MATAVSDSSLAAREAMIDSQLKPCGITAPQIAAAFHAVAREIYVPVERRRLAYVDAPQPVAQGRELLAPLALGYLLQVADLRKTDKVLIVGAATGYASAVIAQLAGQVTALESDAALAADARQNLADLDNVRIVEGPLANGWSANAPYDAIFINGGIEILPPAFAEQLHEDGRLLTIMIGADGVGRATHGTSHGGVLVLKPFAEIAARVLAPFARTPVFQF